jgi:hemerythrin-like domain-containing protein
MQSSNTRRMFLSTAVSGVGITLIGCRRDGSEGEKSPSNKKDSEKEPEVTATEDLMREHGVLRRILIVFSEAAPRLRHDPASVPNPAIQSATKLFRAFGEDYHEKQLEEAYIFPAVKKAGGPAADYVDVLIAQHQRGREITDYILTMTNRGTLAAKDATDLAEVLNSIARMYQAHAAREDTIVFPAWKKTLTEAQLDQMSDKFEDIEQKQFGKDGFEDAVKQIGEIEHELGLSDLNTFTAPSPPAAGVGGNNIRRTSLTT